MNSFYQYMLALFLIFSKPVFAEGSSNLDLFGFVHKNEPINPKCVYLLQPWMSDYGIVIRSIVVSTCHESNLAFEGREHASISDDGTVGYYENPADGHSYFGYKVLGRTANNIYVLQHLGELGFYRLEDTSIHHYFEEDIQSEKVLTKLSGSDSFCFVSARIEENTVFVTRSKRQGKWCLSDEITDTYDVSEL